MKLKTYSLILVLTVWILGGLQASPPPSSNHGPETTTASWLCQVLVRQHKTIEEKENLPLTEDSLLNSLILAHVNAYRFGNRGGGPVEWRKFDPRWIFKPEFIELYDELIAHFASAPSDSSSPGKSIVEFVDQWEAYYRSQGIDPSKIWTDRRMGFTGKKRFLRSLVLAVALCVQKSRGIGSDKEPVQWSLQEGSDNFVNILTADITAAFGNLDAMQTAYDIYYAKAHGHYITRPPRGAGTANSALASTASALRRITPPSEMRKIWAPWVTSFRDTREKRQVIEDWVSAIQFWQNSKLPLVALVQPSEAGGLDINQVQTQMGKWTEIREFVRALNEEMKKKNLPEVTIGTGIGAKNQAFTEQHWRQELLVQLCLLQVSLQNNIRPYSGFVLRPALSSESPLEDGSVGLYEILPSNPLWRDAGLTMEKLNEILRSRLSE